MSPDALLLQSSTVADSIPFEFSDGVKDSVPCSYIEFAERLVLPEYRDLPEDKVNIRNVFFFKLNNDYYQMVIGPVVPGILIEGFKNRI